MTPGPETAENRLPLTRERIIETALEVIDEDGLQAFSMRRLGADLGVEAMSLYNHISSKEALLQAVTDHLITQTQTPAEGEWKDRLAERFSSMRRGIMAHPNAMPLHVRYHAHSPASFSVIEEGLALLRGAGFDPRGTIIAHRILCAFTIGSAVIESGEPMPGSGPRSESPHLDLPEAEFPCLHELHAYHDKCGFDEGFEHSIRMIIDAVESHFLKSSG